MADIFNLDNHQPQIQNNTSPDKCPICGYDVTEQTKICPNCQEILWEDPETVCYEVANSNESFSEEISQQEKKIQKYESSYYTYLTLFSIVIAIPLIWMTYKEFSDNHWIQAICFVLVVYSFVCKFIGYLLKGFIRSLAENKSKKKD